MPEEIRERRVIVYNGSDGISAASRIVFFIVDIIEILLAIRFILKILAANSANAFVSAIYSLTAPLVAPFLGIFSSPPVTAGSVLEWGTLIAMLIYGLIGYALVRILRGGR
ncbi:MAG: YggT family protein [Candidatus Harrisonbacteria bacterium]|nr:YggT family protein [Candidatus Harrisonbacteria bacterium]